MAGRVAVFCEERNGRLEEEMRIFNKTYWRIVCIQWDNGRHLQKSVVTKCSRQLFSHVGRINYLHGCSVVLRIETVTIRKCQKLFLHMVGDLYQNPVLCGVVVPCYVVVLHCCVVVFHCCVVDLTCCAYLRGL